MRNLPGGGYFFFFVDLLAVFFGADLEAAFLFATFAAVTGATSALLAVFFVTSAFLFAAADFPAADFLVFPPSLSAGAEKMRSQFVQNLGFVPVRTIGPLMKVTSILY